MLADEEVSPDQATRFRRHLASCGECRARATRTELAIADFVELHQDRFHRKASVNPAIRASLKAQLRMQAAEPEMRTGFWRPMAYAAMLLVMVGAGFWLLSAQKQARSSQTANLSLPDRRFTPGAVQPAAVADLCRMSDSDAPPEVAQAVKQQVFDDYGLPVSTSRSYELDYLITPQLGGANDPKNLWPEPYSSTEWNAHIKDELEDRFHDMVCDGRLDLATAQREISGDWIAAYKKYFNTQVPLSEAQARNRMPALFRRVSAGY
ncbi:zf-HC2 domain-containing protein [Silvibacterium acidisoli]|uniref:zf-HC2 domain-containing protein n=1 Tax=Acidobacteriaceae bacterium ZG23-2 TaxID=2883246 RepID=UPI00406CD08A